MRLSGMSLRAKVYWSFLIVVTIFSLQLGYNIVTLGTLAQLQDAGATTAQDAVDVEAIQTRVVSLYQIIGDAVINGNFQETDADLAALKKQMESDFKRLDQIAILDVERKSVADFKGNFMGYVALFEGELLPLLRGGAHSMKEVKALDDQIDKIRNNALKS
ncbi:MAG TPA: hypothetical protein VF678_12475, partial [bacterium]